MPFRVAAAKKTTKTVNFLMKPTYLCPNLSQALRIKVNLLVTPRSVSLLQHLQRSAPRVEKPSVAPNQSWGRKVTRKQLRAKLLLKLAKNPTKLIKETGRFIHHLQVQCLHKVHIIPDQCMVITVTIHFVVMIPSVLKMNTKLIGLGQESLKGPQKVPKVPNLRNMSVLLLQPRHQ